MFKQIAQATFLTLALAGAGTAQQTQAPDTMIVLDVSNSMWGQIDGVPKYEIARDVISDMVQDLSPESDYGLIAYGHRRKSDCSDIELLLPIGPLDPAAFSAAVNSLTPKGRTPLTDAVRTAAEVMGYAERAARIILVSDGLESCDADPCALATELEASGLDFTTHVIGFDVGNIDDQSQLSCLAHITGGLYLTADSTEELSLAFEAVAQPVAPPTFTLVAVDPYGNRIHNSAIAWSIENLTDKEFWMTGETGASVTVEYQADDYRAVATLGKREGELVFNFDGEANSTYEVILPPDVKLDAPREVDAGSTFSVEWQGPGRDTDRIVMVESGATANDTSPSITPNSGSPVELVAPAHAGPYQILYLDGDGDILGSTEVNVIVAATLEAAPETVAGSEIDVTWTGPDNRNDYITIVPAGAETRTSGNYSYTREGSPLELQTTDQHGSFELRYISGATKAVLASRPITLTEPVISLEAPAEAVFGSEVDVAWMGPDNRNDYIKIVSAGSEDRADGNYTYTREGSPLGLKTIDQVGAFEIRYYSGQSNRPLASTPITLIDHPVSLEFPSEAVAGADVRVTWVGPDNQNDYIAIVEAGADEGTSINYEYTRRGSPLDLKTVDHPGIYEIRYVSGQSRSTLASAEITLTDTPVSLEFPSEAVAGAEIEVIWVGPDNQNDYIAIVEAGADEGTSINYQYTRRGSPLDLKTVDRAGIFEIRYVSGQSRATMATATINLTEPVVSLDIPAEAIAGADIEVAWVGPDNQNDYIAIVEVGADEGTSINYEYTRRGAPLELQTADRAGNFEVRYVSGQSRATLASQPITLTAPEVSLEAAPVAFAGNKVTVTWVGPDNKNDYIAIVQAGADEGESETYQYTRRGSPVEINVPDETGDYEIRYVSGQSRATLATRPLSVEAE